MHRGLAIIKEEHRSLAAVVHGLSYLVADLQRGAGRPNFPLFRAILTYIEGFPDRLHHPKEDDYLFKALRRRTDKADDLLAELEAEHRREPEDVTRLGAALAAYEKAAGTGGEAAALEAFADLAETYVDFTFRHIAKEEGKILPLAMRVLTDEDWAEIDAAFAANDDPLIGVDSRRAFREVFDRILALAPAPIGLA